MDTRYKPAMWIGDNKNSAAERFIREMDEEMQSPSTPAVRRSFYISPTMMLEMNQLYAYMLPHLSEQLEPERKMLFLKDSKVLDYLANIEKEHVAELQLGDFPAIEALAFAVITMRNDYPPEKPINLDTPRDTDESDLARPYITKSAFD
jgi:hypothetical protein